jgi:hypothetical protein
MNNTEATRGDTSIFKIMDKNNCQLLQKYKVVYYEEQDKVLKILDLILCSIKRVINLMSIIR